MNVYYAELVNLITTARLVAGEEYILTDYPSYPIHLKAKSEKELFKSGWCEYNGIRYDLLYEPIDGSEFSWHSNYGWVYYMHDPTNRVSAYFDFLTHIENSENITVNEYRDEHGKLVIPEVFIKYSKDVYIGFNNDRITVNGSVDVIIGDMNEAVSVYNSNNVNVKDMNFYVSLDHCNFISIGSLNNEVVIDGASGVSIDSSNTILNVYSEGIILGNRNFMVDIDSGNNTVGNLNRNINLMDQYNEVCKSSHADIKGLFNRVEDSDSVITDKESIGNVITSSSSVSVKGIRNNVLNTKDVELTYTDPFCHYVQEDDKRVFRNMLDVRQKISDSRGVVLDKNENKLEQSKRGITDYIDNGGIWEAVVRPGKPFAEGTCKVIITAPKELALIASFAGDGTYERGDEATISATGSGFTIHGWIESISGTMYNEAEPTITVDDNKIFTPLYVIN